MAFRWCAAVVAAVISLSVGPAGATDRPGIWVERPEWNAWVRAALGTFDRAVSDTPGTSHYRATYVRCYTTEGWRAVGVPRWIMGFYLPDRRSPWIHVRESTCRNGLKARAGQLDATNVVALMIILHEAFHRQGVDREADAQCLAAETVFHVLTEERGEARANRAYRLATRWARRHLPPRYLYDSDAACRAAASARPWSRWR